MRGRWKKNVLWIGFVVTLLASTIMVNKSFSEKIAWVYPPIILDGPETPGSTFSVDVSIENVEKLFAYEFYIHYNATVLTATDISSYDPFTVTIIAPQINDTEGWAYMAYSMPFGEEEGFSSVDPAAIAKIDFTVTTAGTSLLELKEVKLTGPKSEVVQSFAVNGFFANVAEVDNHDIAIIDFVVPSSVQVDELVTVTVDVENIGEFSETFDVSLYLSRLLIDVQTDITLDAGVDTTLTFSWNTTDVPEDTYAMWTSASAVPGEFRSRDNFRTVNVAVGEVADGGNGEPGQDYTLYIVAAVVIVVVVAALVYVVKIRKPKQP